MVARPVFLPYSLFRLITLTAVAITLENDVGNFRPRFFPSFFTTAVVARTRIAAVISYPASCAAGSRAACPGAADPEGPGARQRTAGAAATNGPGSPWSSQPRQEGATPSGTRRDRRRARAVAAAGNGPAAAGRGPCPGVVARGSCGGAALRAGPVACPSGTAAGGPCRCQVVGAAVQAGDSALGRLTALAVGRWADQRTWDQWMLTRPQSKDGLERCAH